MRVIFKQNQIVFEQRVKDILTICFKQFQYIPICGLMSPVYKNYILEKKNTYCSHYQEISLKCLRFVIHGKKKLNF